MTNFYRRIICVFYSGSSSVSCTAVCLENSIRVFMLERLTRILNEKFVREIFYEIK